MEDVSSQQQFIQQIIKFTLHQEENKEIRSLGKFQLQLYQFLVRQMYDGVMQKGNYQRRNVINVVKTAAIKKKLVEIDIKPFVLSLQKIHSKVKYPVALTIVFLLTLNKEKSLSIILGFYYEILNAFIKQLKKDSDQKKRTINKKITEEQSTKAQDVNRFCSAWLLEAFEALIQCSKFNMGNVELNKQQHERLIMFDMLMIHAKSEKNVKFISGIFKTSKVLKIVSSLLCLPEKYLSPVQLLGMLYKTLKNYFHSNEILSKVQYKVANKLEQYKKEQFSQKDVILLLKILLYGINPEIETILDQLFDNVSYQSQLVSGEGPCSDKISQLKETQESQEFCFQSKKEVLSKLFDLISYSTTMSKIPNNEQTSQRDLNFGYHLTCFLIKIVSKQYFLKDKKSISSSSLIKQIVFYISTEFLHKIYSFSAGNQNIKFYNVIISTLISQSDIFILKVCLNFVQNETILHFTVHKLKSLFKLLTDIAKKLKKMDSSSTNKNESQKQLSSEVNQNSEKQTKKLKQQESQVSEQVELAKLKISRILRIFDELSQRFKDKSPQIIFTSGCQSLLQLEKIKSSNSFIFSMRINDRRRLNQNTVNLGTSSIRKVQSEIVDKIRLFQFVLGKSETYEVYVNIKPTLLKNGKTIKSSISQIFQQILLQANSSYVVDVSIFQQKKLIIKDQLRNIDKVAGSCFQFTICVSCNKLTDTKGTVLLIKINEKLFSITSKQKRNEVTSFQLGLSINKSLNYPVLPLDFIVKHMYFFGKQVPETLMSKNDFSSVSFSVNTLLQLIGGIESINYRISVSSEELIENFKKQDSLFFKKELKITQSCIQKRRSISFIEIFQQIGGLNSIFYILQKINKSYATHFGQKTQYFFIQLFKILRNVGSNDRESFIFKELKSCYSYIFHFLILIFKRNEHLANQRNSLFLEAIFKFIMFFSSSFTKNQTTKQYPLQEVLEMQLTFIKEVLCNFQLWSECSIEIQSYVFQTLQGFIKNEKYSYVLFPIDLHSKILSSVTFFYSQQPYNILKNKFQQRILLLSEILYDKVINLLFDEKNSLQSTYNLQLLFNLLRRIAAKQNKEEVIFTLKLDKSDKIKGQNMQVASKRDLIMLFERYIHRDVNETIGLINLLLIYHSKHFHANVPTSQQGTKSPTSMSPKQQKLNTKMSMISSSDSKKSPNSNNSSSIVNLPSSLRTCSNLLAYFLKNFVEKDLVFSKINEDWGYVLGILTRFIEILLETRVQSKLLPLKKQTKISNSCEFYVLSKILNLIFKIVSKNQSFFNYMMNSLDKVLTFKGLQFLESFGIASQIINLNKKYNFDIVETVFFLLNKKFNNLTSNNFQREIIEFLSQTDLEKILYKMADSCLTESRQFEEFMQKVQRQIIHMQDDLFMEQLVLEPSLTVLKTVSEIKQKVEIVVEQRSVNKLQKQFTLIDILDQVDLLSKRKIRQASITELQTELKISKSKQSLIKVFELYEDVLFSICYETGSICLQNRQWIQSYFNRKYKEQKVKCIIEKANLLKGKRINSQSNLLIAYFCSTQATVNFVFDIFQRNAFEQLQEQLLQKRQVFDVDSLKTIRQYSPVKQVSNSYSSKISSIALSKKSGFPSETQQQINQSIFNLLNHCDSVSFYLANPKISFSQIILFHQFMEEHLNKNVQIASLSKRNSISLLYFIRLYLLGSSFSYLLEKYSYHEENASQVEKPMDAIKRKENTLNALELIGKCIQNKYFQYEGFYNCLLNESEINHFKSQKILIFDKDNFSQEKKVKIQKQIQQHLKKFIQTWYIDTNKTVKINLHDKSHIKSPKKLNLQEKNIYDTFFDKIKFICFETKNEDQKINELFTFMTENTRGNIAKQFLSLLNKLTFTLKYTIQQKYLLCILQNHQILNKSQFPISCPKNPSQVFSQKLIMQYREQITGRFNKILQIERRKGQRCEKQYRKNEKENQFWLQIQEKEFQRKDVIYEIDEKEMGPFGFYKLNIKPSQQRMQQIHYPRRKMFASIHDSQQSQHYNDQQSNNDIDQLIVLNRTRLIEISMDNSYLEEKNQRRSTLMDVNLVKSVINPGIERKNDILGSASNKVAMFYCQWVTKRGVYAGKLVVRQEWLQFKYLSHLRLPDELVYKMSTGKFHQINSLTEQQQSSISALRIPFKRCKMFTRRYILRHTAVELFSKVNHQSYFFNLFYQSERKNLIQLTRQRFQECFQDRKQQFFRKQYTQQWKIGQLSNFQYLCLINQFSGRSTNDLAQYYVFPWVITNYDGKNGFKQIDENFFMKKQNMRDLSCPPGKLSQQKFAKLKMRLMQLEFCEAEERFLYGTMFSNPTVLYNFFIRLQPYIHLHWEHQGKRIDHADRLFSSIQEQFSSVLVASSDMKELTPEFYYWPEFLKNRSYIDLGLKQNKQPVDDVILPIWAHTPEQFIFKMRQALQSNAVSQHLHQWIDLTFGYQIKYQNAEKYDNLYHFNCYEREIDYFQQFDGDEKQIKSLQVTISEFGQIPQALFDEPHPQKNVRHEFLIIDRAINVKYQKSSSSKSIDNYRQKRGFQTCKQGLFVWTATSVQFKKSYITQNYSYDQQHRVFPSSGGLTRLLSFQDQCWLTLNQGVLRIYLKRILKFQSNIEAQCIDVIGMYFVYSKKSSLFIGQYDGSVNRLMNRKTLFGHKDEIIYLTCSKRLDLILSVDLQGFVIIHELQNLSFLRNFQLPLQKQWSRNDLQQSLSIRQSMLKVQIHEMGYFIFLLNQRKLLIMTFLGQKFLEHDIQISSSQMMIKGKKEQEKINQMLIFRHDRPILLLGTDKGNIYQIDFIEIKRYNSIFPYKTFTSIHSNILQLFLQQQQLSYSVMKSTFLKKSSFYSQVSTARPIYRMAIQKIPGDKISLYQLIVQYEDGEMLCFYQQKYCNQFLLLYVQWGNS